MALRRLQTLRSLYRTAGIRESSYLYVQSSLLYAPFGYWENANQRKIMFFGYPFDPLAKLCLVLHIS